MRIMVSTTKKPPIVAHLGAYQALPENTFLTRC